MVKNIMAVSPCPVAVSECASSRDRESIYLRIQTCEAGKASFEVPYQLQL